jgi:hypothetical protein
MIPRGEVGLVFAGIGSASGALSKPLEDAIIIMVIFSGTAVSTSYIWQVSRVSTGGGTSRLIG